MTTLLTLEQLHKHTTQLLKTNPPNTLVKIEAINSRSGNIYLLDITECKARQDWNIDREYSEHKLMKNSDCKCGLIEEWGENCTCGDLVIVIQHESCKF